MKKITILNLTIAILLVLFVLLLPVKKGTSLDGGTTVYESELYKVVVWNKYYVEINEDKTRGETQTFQKTSVFRFLDNL